MGGPAAGQVARTDAAATPSGAVVDCFGQATVPLPASCKVALIEAIMHLLDLRAAAGARGPDDALTAARDGWSRSPAQRA